MFDYALLGEVMLGMDIVEKIGGIQVDLNFGQFVVIVLIKSIKVIEK